MTTNRERINNMTNEELAEFFKEYIDCNNCPIGYDKCTISKLSCKEIFMQWLNQESEE